MYTSCSIQSAMAFSTTGSHRSSTAAPRPSHGA
jgi:hypothetical protein